MTKLINEILFEIRKSHKLSRKKLETLSGFKERTIIGYENGSRKPSDEYIRFVSLYFNVLEDYIRGLSDEKKEYTLIKRTLLMYQDVYNCSDVEMGGILNLDRNFGLDMVYRQILESDVTDIKKRNAPLLVVATEQYNIKPSSIGLTVPSLLSAEEKFRLRDEEFIARHGEKTVRAVYEENKEWHEKISDRLDYRIKIMEEKGIKFDAEYYAQMIKKRNEAKENFTPDQEIKKLPEKYQRIVDLLPYASDSFLDELYKKLNTLKELQTL